MKLIPAAATVYLLFLCGCNTSEPDVGGSAVGVKNDPAVVYVPQPMPHLQFYQPVSFGEMDANQDGVVSAVEYQASVPQISSSVSATGGAMMMPPMKLQRYDTESPSRAFWDITIAVAIVSAIGILTRIRWAPILNAIATGSRKEVKSDDGSSGRTGR